MSAQSDQRAPDNDKPPPPTRAQRLAAFGFLGAFGLTILTVLLTGLSVGAPSARHVLQPVPAAAGGAPSKPENPRGLPSAERTERTSPAAPPPEAAEPGANTKASREDPARERDERTRKDLPRNRDDSRADDAR